MNEIVMVSKDIQEDYKKFLNALIEKYKIKDSKKFEEDFNAFISKNVRKEHADISKLENKEEEINIISKEFFNLISRHADNKFDFKEEMFKEISVLKDVEINGQ